MSETLFATPAALAAACLSIPAETLPPFREAMRGALREKIAGMEADAPAISKLAKIARDVEAGIHDAALRVMLAMGIPANFFNRKVRGGGESFNEKAIPKALMLARLMLSTNPAWDGSSDANTTRGTIRGVLKGLTGKPLVDSVVDYMLNVAMRPKYSASGGGGTQTSSSAHALSAMGLLTIPSRGDYRIPSPLARDVLICLYGNVAMAGAGGAAEQAPPQSPPEAPTGASPLIIDGECQEVRQGLPSLPYAPAGASVGGLVPWGYFKK